MKGDLNDIVAKRNAKLAAKNAPKRVPRSPGVNARLAAALGPASAYVQDACKIASDRAALMLARRGS